MAAWTSPSVVARVRTYPLTSMITDAFSASSRPLSPRLARPRSNQATSFGRIGSPLIGIRTTHGCR